MTKFYKALSASIFTVIAAFLVFTPISNAASTGTVSCNGLNVRKLPDTSAKIITQLAQDSKVSIIEHKNDWYKISSSGSQGWVLGQYLKIKAVAIGSGTINASSVNIREKANTSSKIVANLGKSVKLGYYEVSGDWYKVKLSDGTFGWIKKDFFAVRKSENSRGITKDTSKKQETVILVEESTDVATDNKDSDNTSSELAQKIIDYGKKFLGVKYVYGAMSPTAFDCSGFTSYVFKHFGIKLERSSAGQGSRGTKIKKSELRPGDLVFFDTNGGNNHIEHVGLYIGNGKFMHASSGRSKKRVVISNMNEGFYLSSYMCARRYIR